MKGEVVTIDPRDAALAASCPVVAAPSFGRLEPHEQGQRMVLANDGVYLQFRNPWLSCTTRVGAIKPGLRLPYGSMAATVEFAFGTIPLALLDEFIEHGREALPREAAGALIYDCKRRALALRMHEALDAGSGHIHYRVAAMDEDEVLAVDLHTHGCHGAFWSQTDNRDDLGIRVCGVFGNLDRDRVSARFRLALNGLYVDLPNPWEGQVAS
jgi:PRTRC genetic system protein A